MPGSKQVIRDMQTYWKSMSDLIFTAVMVALERCNSQRLGPSHNALKTALPETGYLPHVYARPVTSRRANKFLDF